MPRDQHPPTPDIPDYVLLREIGRGSYGVVWLARSVTGLYRAVKIVWRAAFEEPQPYEREFRGITEFAAISLGEPRQLALLHVGRNDAAGFFYCVMELADDAVTGREIDPEHYVPHTLRDARSRRGRFSVKDVVTLGVDLAGALAGLHAHGLVHRDIKPSNIIFVGGVPKLADIGLVTSAAATDLSISRVGNPGYMPPDFPGVPSADVYGLGKVLYELATGRDREDYPRLPIDLGQMPDRKALLELNEILVRACAPDPARRYADGAALRDDLLLLQAGRSLRRLRATERHLARALRAVVALVIVAGIGFAGAGIQHHRASQAEAERDEYARRMAYAGQLAQAQRSVEQRNFGAARHTLRQAVPPPGLADLRGFEWRVLWHRAQGDPSEILRADGPLIDRIEISPDGSLLAVHDEAKTVALHATASRRELRRIPGIHRLAGFSSDATWLVGTDPAFALQRWRVVDGTPGGPPRSGAIFRPLAAAGTDGVVAYADGQPASLQLWDFRTGRDVFRLPLGEVDDDPPWGFFRAAVADNGAEALVASVRRVGETLHYRLSRAEFSPSPTLTHQPLRFRASALGAQHSPEGTAWWVVENARGEALLYDPHTKRWTSSPTPLPPEITAQADYPHAGRKLVVQSVGTELWLRHHADQPVVHRLGGHGAVVTGFALSPNSSTLFSASAAGDLRAWNLSQASAPSPARQCRDSAHISNRPTYSADSRTLYVPESDGGVVALDGATLAPIALVSEMLRPIAFHDGFLWGISSDNRAIVVWSPAERRVVRELVRAGSPIIQAALSGNGRTLALARADGGLSLTDVQHPDQPILVAGRHARLFPLQLNETGTRLWILNADRQLSLRGFPDGRELCAPFPVQPRAVSYVWLQRTGMIVVAAEDGELAFYDDVTGAVRHPPTRLGGAALQHVSALRDESRLLCADAAGDVQIIDVKTRTSLATIRSAATPEPASSVTAGPDGRSAAVISKAGVLRVVFGGDLP